MFGHIGGFLCAVVMDETRIPRDEILLGAVMNRVWE